MNRLIITVAVVLFSGQAGAQTMYKCPSPTPGAPPIYQQAPCTPQGGGETVEKKVIKTTGGIGLSDEGKSYLEEQTAKRAGNATKPQEESTLHSHIESIRREELAQDCYKLEKRIHYIQKLEQQGSHIKENSIGDDDSREAIEEYKKKCGHWGG